MRSTQTLAFVAVAVLRKPTHPWILRLKRLLGLGRRMLPGVAEAGHGAAPLMVTEVRREDLRVTLPGKWREHRSGELLELVEIGGGHRLSIRVKRLLAPLAEGDLPALVGRVLDEHCRQAAIAAEAPLEWDAGETFSSADHLERRVTGATVARSLQVALLAEAAPGRIVSATLVGRNAASGAPATAATFGALAAVVFDQLGRGRAAVERFGAEEAR